MKELIIKFIKEFKEDPIKAIVNIMKSEVFLYLLFGFLTTVVNLICFTLSREYFINNGIRFNFFGVQFEPWTIAEILAFIVAVLFAFFVDKFIVFKAHNTDKLMKELASFFGARIFSECICLGVMFVMITLNHMPDISAKIVTLFINIVLNYLASKLFIFKKK